jgi:diacylglycerol kinase
MPSFKKSLFFALNGLKIALKEKHIRVHLVAVLIVTAAGFYFRITQTEWLMCLVLFALVIGIEILNTAIERFVDMVQPGWNEKAGKVKDLAAGAVLWSSILAAICGTLIFGKYILALF